MIETKNEVTARWVLPAFTSMKYYGVVTFDGQILLKIILGSIEIPASITNHIPYAETAGGSRTVLFDGYLVELQHGEATFRFDHAILGLYISDVDHENNSPILVASMTFRFDILDKWAIRGAADRSTDGDVLNIRHSIPDPIVADIDGGTVSLVTTKTESFGTLSYSYSYGNLLYVELAEPCAPETVWRKYQRGLRYLLSLLTFWLPETRPVHVTAGQAGEDPRRCVIVNGVTHEAVRASYVTVGIVPATFNELHFPAVLTKWFELVDKYDSVLDLLFVTDVDETAALTSRFFSVASAAEAMHGALFPDSKKRSAADTARVRRIAKAVKGSTDTESGDVQWLHGAVGRAHEPSFSKRLGELFEFVGQPAQAIANGDVQQFCADVVELRNDIAHANPITQTDWDMRRLQVGVDLLMRLVALRELGFTDHELYRATDAVRTNILTPI
ncbi:HEPN domain-containing protein [Kutzneria sp. NPDC052558]|uniref:HEPN domain-containing protein n=1 Tax=Kutzneria sp. NPDC052558 TaxID=3364121 RepID=UPI0037C60FDB